MKQIVKRNINRGKRKRMEKPTSYDTTRPDTATPQNVRESGESSGEFERQKKMEGKKGE